jgi:hypothetical protein
MFWLDPAFQTVSRREAGNASSGRLTLLATDGGKPTAGRRRID